MAWEDCYVSNQLLDKMKDTNAGKFYKVTRKSGGIIIVFDPELKDGVYDVHVSDVERNVSVCTSSGNNDKNVGWTDYIVEKLKACKNSFADKKNANYYSLKEEEDRENPKKYKEFSEAAKEFDELPKGTVLYTHPSGVKNKVIERKYQ
jgi:hypothetical protein